MLGDARQAKRFQLFLKQVFAGDAELIDWIQRWCGYLLTGNTTEQVFLFWFGHGSNGKSVFAELLRYIMADYTQIVAPETITETKRKGGGASPDLAALIGCRLALSSETEDGATLAENLIKALTGGDTITARKLYCEPFAFTPSFKLLILGNHKPIVRGNDHAIWRRVRLVPFTQTFSGKDCDPQLLSKLKAEAPHILSWMVDGCIAWQKRGLGDVPKIVAAQTADYRKEQDIIGGFLEECATRQANAKTDGSELYSRYRSWAESNGLKVASKISLGAD